MRRGAIGTVFVFSKSKMDKFMMSPSNSTAAVEATAAMLYAMTSFNICKDYLSPVVIPLVMAFPLVANLLGV